MKLLWVLLSLGVILSLLVILGAYICYRMAFFSPKRKPFDPNVVDLPEGEIYEVYHEDMKKWAQTTRAMPMRMCRSLPLMG